MTEPRPGAALARLQTGSQRALTWIVRLHGPVILAGGLYTGQAVLPAMLLWAAIAAVQGVTVAMQRDTATARAATSAAVCAMPALLLLEFEGHPWQADLHMEFFALLAVSATMLDPRAIVSAAGLVAVHHLVLNLALPEAVFPGSGDLVRVLLHASVLAVETAALLWLTNSAARSLTAAEAAGIDAGRLADERNVLERQSFAASAQARRAATLDVATGLDSALSAVLSGLVESSRLLENSADALASSTTSISHQAGLSAGNSETARHSVQTVAAAAEEMTAAIAEMSARVAEAADAAQQAMQETQSTEATVRELADGATRIDGVVQLINSIAAQTNLLALNATIEAARAGEHGKGFAVVASEVKLLANQTAAATKDIAEQIAMMQDITRRAVAAVGTIGQSVGRSSRFASAIAAVIEQQSAATQEIANAARLAADGTSLASDAAGLVTASVAETAATVQGLRMATSGLVEQGANIRTRVAAFSGRLREDAAAA